MCQAEPSTATTPMRLSPAIDSSPAIPISSLYHRPIPISSLSLTTRSFLTLSPYYPHTHSFFLTIPIPIPILLEPQSDAEIVDVKPLVLSRGTLQIANSKEPFARLDKLILEAITNLNEPRGSDRAAIALYIEA